MLILQAERDALLKPLQVVTGIIERRHTLPILSNVLLKKEGQVLRFFASDLEIQMTTVSTEVIEGEDFELTVSARKLTDILRAIPDKAMVSLEQQDSRITLKAGKSRFNLQSLPGKDYPLLETAGSPQAEFGLSEQILKRLISQVQYAMAVQDIRYYLNGLLLQTDGNEVRLIATDGHRLAFATSTIEQALPKAEVILPRKTIVELYKQLNENSTADVHIELLANQARLSLAATVMISKVVDGKFPDYTRVIPSDNNKLFLVDRLVLLYALQRAAILANEKFRGVRLALRPGCLCIQCTNSEQEEAIEELEIAYQGEALEIGFNINYLLDVLTNVQTETLKLAFGEGNQSALITIPDVPTFKYVVMPMRI